MESQIEFGNGDSQLSTYDYTAPSLSIGNQFEQLNASSQQSDIFKPKVLLN